ncbi:hypothetical protein [Paenibacillus sp. WLX2291]|uniref:hypothetical protein n=1 Tax=Paenibacillus sp. WLX2291 TaxID=3296934 RepID=UPI00398430E0
MAKDIRIITDGVTKTVHIKTNNKSMLNASTTLKSTLGLRSSHSDVYAVPPSDDEMKEIRSFMREVISKQRS